MQLRPNRQPPHVVAVVAVSILTTAVLFLSLLPLLLAPVATAIALTTVATVAIRHRWWGAWPPPGVLMPVALVLASRMAWLVAAYATGQPWWLIPLVLPAIRLTRAIWWGVTRVRTGSSINGWRLAANILAGRQVVWTASAVSTRWLGAWAGLRCDRLVHRHSAALDIEGALAALRADQAGAVVPDRAARFAPLRRKPAGSIRMGRASDWWLGRGWWAPWHARRPVMAPPEAGVGVIMQPRTGKTSGIVAPSVWSHHGPAVVTGVRSDVVWMVGEARAAQGPVGVLVVPGIEDMDLPPDIPFLHWDLLAGGLGGYMAVREVAEAAAFAKSRAGSGSTTGSSSSEDYFTAQAGRLVAISTWWARCQNWDMGAVRRLVAGGQAALAEILSDLDGAREDAAAVADDISTLLQAGDREFGSVMGTAAGILDGWRTSPVDSIPLDPDAWLAAGGTLFCLQPERLGTYAPPVVAGAISHLRQAQARRFQRDRQLPYLLLALDELANVAPIPDLARIVTTGAGAGTIVLAVTHSLTQLQSIYGPAGADAILAGLHHLIIGAGVTDAALLARLSAAGGTTVSTSRSVQSSPDGATTGVTASASAVARWPAEAITNPPKGHATLVLNGRPVDYIRLTPAHEDPVLRHLAGRAPESKPNASPGRRAAALA